MGTLHHQEPRNKFHVQEKDVEDYILNVKEIASKHDMSIDQTIKILENLELQRKNNIAVANGDIHDEQLMGFGDLFQELNTKLGFLADALENNE